MQIDPVFLRRHYATLSDESLAAINRDELVEDARRVYDQEIKERKLEARGEAPESGEESFDQEEDRQLAEPGDDIEPDWLEEAAVATTFFSYPGDDAGVKASEARDALEAAGIPCHLSEHAVDPEQRTSQPEYEYRLMVPGKLNLEAGVVLESSVFNADVEAEWNAHFQMLSDEELRALDLDALFGGLRDRIERVTKAYQQELKRRR